MPVVRSCPNTCVSGTPPCPYGQGQIHTTNICSPGTRCLDIRPRLGLWTGAAQKCGDDGRGNTTSNVISLTLGGTTSGYGLPPSPFTLDYTVDFSAIPKNALILCAVATYSFETNPYSDLITVNDGGGEVMDPSSFTIHWNPKGLNKARAAKPSEPFAVHATFTGTPSGGTGLCKVESFVVRYGDPTY